VTTPRGEGDSPLRLRTYGRRIGRPLRRRQQELLSERLAQRAIDLDRADSTIEPGSLFARPVSDVWLEVGFGAGEHLINQALAHPNVGFVGCEPYVNGVASLLASADALSLDRVRVFPDDARLLMNRLADASVGRVFVLFADPWPKRRHHRRRFIQAETVTQIVRILRPGGEFLFASDDADYARWTLAAATDDPALVWCATQPRDWREPPEGWIATRYQRKALLRGANCVYLRFRRDCCP
jgi:tRNA (guanine-N7-)-methyltransferase